VYLEPRPGKTLCGWSIPGEHAQALERRATKKGVEIHDVVTDFFERYLAQYIADSIQKLFAGESSAITGEAADHRARLRGKLR
jgi:hypothetical protein